LKEDKRVRGGDRETRMRGRNQESFYEKVGRRGELPRLLI